MSTTVIAISSVVVALASLFASIQSQRRAERVAIVETHLALRGRFIDLYQHLELEPDRNPARAAAQAYWANAYDEWFITTRLTPEFKRLWIKFYGQAIVAGLAHPVLEQELRHLLGMQEGFGLYADDFVEDLEELAGKQLREQRDRPLP
jgi:hypothetical protein